MANKHSADKKAEAARGNGPSGLLGSLRDALRAASRTEPGSTGHELAVLPPAPAVAPHLSDNHELVPLGHHSADAAAPGGRDLTMYAAQHAQGGESTMKHVHAPLDAAASPAAEPTPRTQPAGRAVAGRAPGGDARTQALRGRQKVARAKFHQDPVVAWLVIVGGPGLGAWRPVFEGNNTIGRAATQRVPIDFGDASISGEEQAYIRYDSSDRSFLFVPNLAKTNVVQINDRRPTGAVELAAMDVITMGRTQLVFVPFCGPEFDWGELTEARD